jgi:hypothetical protein
MRMRGDRMPSDWYQTRPYVLRYPVGEQQVETFARALGWVLSSEIPEDPSAGVSRQVVWEAPGVASIHFIEDLVFHRPYYVLMGSQRLATDALAAQAEAVLNPWTVEELVEVCEQAEGLKEKGSAAILLSLAAPPEYDERVFAVIESMLLDEDPTARDAALWLTLYARYSEFGPTIERIAENDPEDWVRDRAVHVLGVRREQGLAS